MTICLGRCHEKLRWFDNFSVTSRSCKLTWPNTSQRYWTVFVYFQIKYTGYRDRSHEERIVRFQTEARDGQATVVSWRKLFLKEFSKTFGKIIAWFKDVVVKEFLFPFIKLLPLANSFINHPGFCIVWDKFHSSIPKRRRWNSTQGKSRLRSRTRQGTESSR